ncbi:MAG TPA: restriction endonuclease subunit S [Fibrobacteres bacterium]|nr:restriction endonuclease subunit S [Fibrobacterota bacterium]
MSEWKEFKLTDISDIFDEIRVPLSKMERVSRKGKYPYYGASGIIDHVDDFLFEGEYVLISEDGENLKTRQTPIAFKANGQFWVNNHAHIVKGKALFINDLIVYVLQNLDLHPFLTGAVQPKLNQENLLSIPFSLPVDENEQRAIASILSSLDDKIDLLHRQNKTLEAMAEALFKKWFVEEAEDGWENVELEYVAKKITDGSHQSPSSTDTGMPMASVKDMHQWGINYSTCRKISKVDYQKLVRDDCRPLKDDILIAKDGSYLKHIFFVPEDMNLVVLSSIAIIRPNGKYHPILLSIFLKMDSTKELLKNIVTGAVIPRIVLKDFRKFPIILPTISEQKKSLEIIEPLITKCYQNIKKIYTLESLRNTLLPKLMSGEVKVNNV